MGDVNSRREFLVGCVGIVVAGSRHITLPSLEDALKGVPILRMDHPNKNNRIYPVWLMRKAIRKIEKTPIFGKIGTLDGAVVHLSKVAFQADNFYMTNGSFGPMLHCDIELLEKTPMCRLFKEMVEKNPEKFEYRTAGIGGGRCDDQGILTLDNFSITCITASLHEAGS